MGARANRSTSLAFLLFLAVMFCGVAGADVLYVAAAADPGGDGSSWEQAFDTLREGLAAAVEGDEIRVAQGIYRPDRETDPAVGTGDRHASFVLKNGVRVLGGYGGPHGQYDPDYRSASRLATVLSGDLAGDDVEFAETDWEGVRAFVQHPSRAENSYTVVNATGTAGTAVLDGFVITGGNANLYSQYEPGSSQPDPPFERPDNNGGGLYMENGAATIIDCTFLLNTALSFQTPTGGGGMCCVDSVPRLYHCRFVSNLVFSGDVCCRGGGMLSVRGNPVLTGCGFERNVAQGFDSEYYGGGVCSEDGYPSFSDCLFLANSAGWSGGGLWNRGDASLVRCAFRENSAMYTGGGLLLIGPDDATVVEDCLFQANEAGDRGGGAVLLGRMEASLVRCMFSDNRAEYEGGGACVGHESTLHLKGCTFLRNISGDGGGVKHCGRRLDAVGCAFQGNRARRGGGLTAEDGSLEVQNCVFAGNTADGDPAWAGGGGVSLHGGAEADLAWCTFADNLATRGTAILCNSHGDTPQRSDVNISHCILWEGEPMIANVDGSSVRIEYSDLRNGVEDPMGEVAWGEGNFDAEPYFARVGERLNVGTPDDPFDDLWTEGNYHVQSRAGMWDPRNGRWGMSGNTSPCIDAGNPALPVGAEPFPNGGIVNVGAYGGTVEASKSWFGQPLGCETALTGDLNGDCAVDLLDLALLAVHWMEGAG